MQAWEVRGKEEQALPNDGAGVAAPSLPGPQALGEVSFLFVMIFVHFGVPDPQAVTAELRKLGGLARGNQKGVGSRR